MSDFTSVNAASMATAIGDLKNAHSKVEEDLTSLEGELEGSLSEWTGEAREAYRQAKAKWDAAANHMAQVIQVMGSTMQGIGENYDSNERSIQSAWG